MDKKVKLRDILVDVALQWQASFGIAPSITSSEDRGQVTVRVPRGAHLYIKGWLPSI